MPSRMPRGDGGNPPFHSDVPPLLPQAEAVQMRYLALCTDYDGTIATHGGVDEPTFAALARLKGSGRKLIMVTGREIHELVTVCPRLDLFDLVVAENGATLYNPATKAERPLWERPR